MARLRHLDCRVAGVVLAVAFARYADLLAGILALVMVGLSIWLSAKGMELLKRSDDLSDNDLEIAYRYRNAGIAFGLTGSGLLVFSWQSFLARFINV